MTHGTPFQSRSFRVFCLAFALLSLLSNGALAAERPATTSRIEARRGELAVRTVRETARLDSGALFRVDRLGRIHRPSRERRAPDAGRRTTLLVTEGAVMARPLGPVEAGWEALAAARRSGRRQIGRAGLRRLAALTERLPRVRGLAERDRAEITRITWTALGRIESLEADGLFDDLALDGRFANRPFTWYGDLLREIAPRLVRCRAALVLMAPEATAPGRAAARFVVSFELIPKLMPLERITLSGSGVIEYARPFGAWRIAGGEIRAFVVDSELLPSEFVRLRELTPTGT